ncbi:MAG: hypothetical protein LAO03_01125 [Acidobacteriia bacterium]|nr:hypothetical protein [Terriglobia bacterium]
MTSAGASIHDHKQRGEWAEMRFMARAAEQGFRVTKPWGDSARYDFILELHGRCVRVQVKSTIHRRAGGYLCAAMHSGAKRYTLEQVDFFAAYVIPEDVWYIVPAEVVTGGAAYLLLTPGHQREKYGRYKEAWHLMLDVMAKRPEQASPEPTQAAQESAGRDAGLVSADNCATEIAEMRGTVEPTPSPDFDPDLLRERLTNCFDRLRSRR